MNEDNPFRVTNGDMFPDRRPYTGEPRLPKAMEQALNDLLIAVPCAECGEPVRPEDAFPVEIERPDGASEVAVFHRDFTKLCPGRPHPYWHRTPVGSASMRRSNSASDSAGSVSPGKA